MYKMSDFEDDLMELIELCEKELKKRIEQKQQDYIDMFLDIILPELKKLLNETQSGAITFTPKKDRRLASAYWLTDGWSFNVGLDQKIISIQNHYRELK